MKRVVALFYDKYYTDNTCKYHYKKTLFVSNCDHTMDEGPSKNLKESILEWFYMAMYDDQNLPWVSDSLIVFSLLCNKT